MSQITTHVLDTTIGKPAAGVTIILYVHESDWLELAKGITDANGRLGDLLPPEELLPQATYKLKFIIKDYFEERSIKTLYPYVEIVFNLDSPTHYHIPLLLTPFGYTTYRGS